MIRLMRAQIQPIGLDIGHDSVRMLQVETIGESLAVVSAAKQGIPDDARDDMQTRLASATNIVRQLLRQGDFKHRRVVASLPPEIVHAKSLRMPSMPPAELASAVNFEVAGMFGFEADQATVHYLPAGEVRQGAETRQEVIVFAVRNDQIANYIEQLHHAGAIIESLDIQCCALYRAVERFIRRREDENEVNVMVDVGWQGTRVVIGRGREISFYKTIETGGRHFNEAVSRKLGISLLEAQSLRRRLADTPEPTDNHGERDPVRQAVGDATRSGIEELSREISLCLRYHSVTFRGQRPGKVKLLGGEAYDSQLLAVLNGTAGIPVEQARPLFSVLTTRMKPADRKGHMSEWALALGLSLKLTTGRFVPRDGKPRDKSVEETPSRAEVVDVNKALEVAHA